MYYIDDNGIEHYNDLTRKDKWIGWKIIDAYIQKNGFFKECHDKCGELEILYKDFKK